MLSATAQSLQVSLDFMQTEAEVFPNFDMRQTLYSAPTPALVNPGFGHMEKGRNICDSEKLMVGEAVTYEGPTRFLYSRRFGLCAAWPPATNLGPRTEHQTASIRGSNTCLGRLCLSLSTRFALGVVIRILTCLL
jgi:hypothetical protein